MSFRHGVPNFRHDDNFVTVSYCCRFTFAFPFLLFVLINVEAVNPPLRLMLFFTHDVTIQKLLVTSFLKCFNLLVFFCIFNFYTRFLGNVNSYKATIQDLREE